MIEGENDFQTVHPELMEEWNYSKNVGINPSKIKSSVAKKVWWKCQKGHEWQATINQRDRGSGCPICASEIQTSFPEKALYYYLGKIFEVESRIKLFNYEVDIYIKSLNLAIEYDGIYYHSKKEKIIFDSQKDKTLKNHNILLIRIKEAKFDDFNKNNNIFYYIPNSYYLNLNKVINSLIKFINMKFNSCYKLDIDIKRDHVDILKTYKSLEIQTSLGNKYPSIAKEWNVSKNGDLTPLQFSAKSHFAVWWKCFNGHEWQAKISDRTKGSGCPICGGKKLLSGYNDLKSCYPEIAKEWNHDKNDITPDKVLAHSHTKAWWKCQNGHEWQAIIYSRSLNRSGCPYCSGNKVIVGVNDLATWCKQNDKEYLLNEFDEIKNGFKASDIFSGGDIIVWWKCQNGHSYSTQIKSRTKNNTNCPYCVNKKILSGYNDLATTHPEIAKEWDYSKNDGILPTEVTAGSIVKKYWFICPQGHSYCSTLLNRKKGKNCPICSGRTASEKNNLLLVDPKLCEEWDYDKNDIKPEEVTPNSGKIVWWKCQICKSEWQAKIDVRRHGFRNCPNCKRNSRT